MGPNSAHRRVSVSPGSLSHPGTLSQSGKPLGNLLFFIAAVLLLMSFTLAEGEGGLGQIYICEPVSRGKSGSL